jgi:putative DNA-invertase from lambdoid prophage Rac
LVQRVALYARASDSDQSCQRQFASLKAYAERTGCEVVGIFAELDREAKYDDIARRKVLSLARRRLIDAVLITELSRWGRSTSDLRSTIQELAAMGVALTDISGLEVDPKTAEGKSMLRMLHALNEFERDLLSEKIHSGIAHARYKGTKSGQAIGRPVFDKLGRVDQLLGQGKSVRDVADELGISKSTVMKVKATMDKDVTGTCKLCGKVDEIVNSHIVPNFILKTLKDERKGQFALLPTLLTAESPREPVQQAMRERLLCRSCEVKFSKWEKRFADGYKQNFINRQPFGSDFFKQDWMLRLALSFAWRAAQAFLIKTAGIFPDSELAIIRNACDFWSQFLLDEDLEYTGARPSWWETRYEDVQPLDKVTIEEIASQPDGLDTYLARFCDYTIGPSEGRIFLWYKIPFLVLTIAIEPQVPDVKLTKEQYSEFLYTRVVVTKNHLDQHTTDEQRKERTESILKRTTQAHRDAFYAAPFGESAIRDQQRRELKSQ